MNILDFQAKKTNGERISMITCYDTTFAALIAASPIDVILVGDSAAMTMHGHPTTLPISVRTMAQHVAAVARAADDKLVIGDLPFLSYRRGLRAAVDAAGALMTAGAHAVKLEGAAGNIEIVAHLVQSGVPVMGHLGLTPQSIHQLGGFKVQGREDRAAEQLRADAKALQEAGAFGLVLEAVPSKLAAQIAKELEIPVIGIGAGPDVDGQVLVLQDMLGLSGDFKPKFLRRYLNGLELVTEAFSNYHIDVVAGKFPSEKESYS